ncbi:MAG: ABC transporter permease [Bacteroidetes bacterium]|nr:ABC transporter permease [Bacteroidota bacterium]
MNPYTFHINLYDLAFLVLIITGLNFALLLGFTKKANQPANRFLALALVVIVLWMIHIRDNDIRLTIEFSLALGPLIYFYVLKLTRPEYKFNRKVLLHFIPVLFEQFILSNSILQFLTFISVISYLFCSHLLIERFYGRQKFNGGDRYRYELGWLHRLLMGFGFLWLLWIPFTTVGYFYHLNEHAWYPFYLCVAGMLIWIAVSAYLRTEANVAVNPSALFKPSPPAELKQKGAWLKKVVKANLYYQDPELSLNSLAEKLELTTHELSRILNNVLKKTFNDFINEYRVRDIIAKMQDPTYDHITLLGIAYDSGFNSQSTFHRAFKELTGKTPAEYKKELPSYNLTVGSSVAAIISNKETTPKWSPEKLNRNLMFRSYLKIAWRNTLNNKVYSALNIAGLATGMAVALLIGLWVADQYSYDRFLPGYQQVYQVEMNLTSQHNGTTTQTSIALPLTDVLRKEIPGIKYVAESDALGLMNHGLLVGDKKLYLGGGAAGPDFFKMFQFPFVKGNPNTALKDTYSIVLTEPTAKALFGDADPMGKTVRIDNSQSLKVTGVIKEIPKNSTLQFHYIMPFAFGEATQDWMKLGRTKWTWNSFNAYVVLEPGANYAQIAPKIRDIVNKRSPEMRVAKPEVFLHPMKDWHLYSDFKNGKSVGGFIEYVRMFSIIGILVLAIACINFMNLSTARSEKRAREVGVRKAIGSGRIDLVYQFLLESILITFISFLLGLLLVQLALPSFNTLTGSYIHIPYGNVVFWCIMIAFILVTGLAAGSRSAFYLSSFNPVKVLKGSIQVGKAAALPRKILVMVQFTCSVSLIISTVIVYQQIQYVKNRPTGYNADRLVMTDMNGDLYQHYDALKNDLLSMGLVESVVSSTSPATQIYSHYSLQKWPGKNAGDEEANVGAIWVSNGYFQTLGMTMAAGRDFSADWKSDSLNVIVNEATVKRMGLKDPINQMISWNGNDKQVRIIGVVKDALMESPYTSVAPAIFCHSPYGFVITYRLPKNANTHISIEKIGKLFEKYNPSYPYQYKFVDEVYASKFNLEVLVGKLAGVFAALAIFISCLGLFGLAAYVAEQRTKEIGIRKVLGASITQVWMLLSIDFVVLVIISCVIASPIALYFLNNWLQKYPYHVSIGLSAFVASGIMAIMVTFFTISFQAIKAALTNPVKSLRSE